MAMKLVLRVFAVPFTAFVRSLVAALLFGVLAAKARTTAANSGSDYSRLTAKDIAWIFVGGVSLGISNTAWNVSLTRTTVGATSVLQLSSSVLLALYGILFLAERCTLLRSIALLLSVCGMFLVSWNGQDIGALASSQYFQGNMFGLGAGVTWAITGVALKLTIKNRPGAVIVAPMFVLSALTMAVPALLGEPLVAPLNAAAIALLLLTGVLGLGVGNFLFAQSMRTIPASIGAAALTICPLLSMTCGTLFLHEPITAYLLVGGPLTSLGVAIAFLSMSNGARQEC